MSSSSSSQRGIYLGKFRFDNLDELYHEIHEYYKNPKLSIYYSIGEDMIIIYNKIITTLKDKESLSKIKPKNIIMMINNVEWGFNRILDHLQIDVESLSDDHKKNIIMIIFGLAYKETEYNYLIQVINKLRFVSSPKEEKFVTDHISDLNVYFQKQYSKSHIEIKFQSVKLDTENQFRIEKVQIIRKSDGVLLYEYIVQKDNVTKDWKWFLTLKNAKQYAAEQLLMVIKFY